MRLALEGTGTCGGAGVPVGTFAEAAGCCVPLAGGTPWILPPALAKRPRILFVRS